jgi:hypothetical protein
VVVGLGDGVKVCVAVGGSGVRVGEGWVDGVQAVMIARSVKRVVIRFTRRVASLIA